MSYLLHCGGVLSSDGMRKIIGGAWIEGLFVFGIKWREVQSITRDWRNEAQQNSSSFYNQSLTDTQNEPPPVGNNKK